MRRGPPPRPPPQSPAAAQCRAAAGAPRVEGHNRCSAAAARKGSVGWRGCEGGVLGLGLGSGLGLGLACLRPVPAELGTRIERDAEPRRPRDAIQRGGRVAAERA
eukprot:scaffold20603_cov36-Phaeocystis_antarctica.AAC.1